MNALFFCDHHTFPLPTGHKFPIEKYRLLREILAREAAFRLEPAPFVERDTILLVHDLAYVEGFLSGSLDPSIMRRIGLPWSEGLVRRTLASVGGTVCASEQALKHMWGGNLAGGTHHACRSSGAGFCVFNDIAIAIMRLQAAGRIRRAAVIDLDVHQGDGTAQIFRDSSEVFTASVHGRNNFPFRKQISDFDIEFDSGVGDDLFLHAVRECLARISGFSPDIIFYQSGVDGLATDRLGKLSLTMEGLRERDRTVFEHCRNWGVPIVVTLGGGYSDPIERTAQAHANTFKTAAQIFR